MKKQAINKLEFNKKSLIELNSDIMSAVVGGGASILPIFVVSSTSLILTPSVVNEGVGDNN